MQKRFNSFFCIFYPNGGGKEYSSRVWLHFGRNSAGLKMSPAKRAGSHLNPGPLMVSIYRFIKNTVDCCWNLWYDKCTVGKTGFSLC